MTTEKTEKKLSPAREALKLRARAKNNNTNIDSNKNNVQNDQKKLHYILVFVDEINRFIPKSINFINKN